MDCLKKREVAALARVTTRTVENWAGKLYIRAVLKRVQGQSQQRTTVAQDPGARRGEDQDAVLSPVELAELEAAIAEDQAGKAVPGEVFLRSLRAPPDPSASREFAGRLPCERPRRQSLGSARLSTRPGVSRARAGARS